jgi:acetyl esterase
VRGGWLSRAFVVGSLAVGLTGAGAVPAGSTALTPGPLPVAEPTASPLPGPAPERIPGVLPPLEEPFVVADGVLRRTLAYGVEGLEQSVDVYTSARGPLLPRPTVLLVHGGGWRIGDSTEWAAEAIELVQARGWTAVSLNYRLAPAAPWPAQLQDAAAAVALLRSRAVELGVDVDRIGAIGDSAGGHLAALLGEPAPGRPALRSVVTWSGINDLAGLLQQTSAGGCPLATSCTPTALAGRVLDDLIGCAPVACPDAYRAASPAAQVTPGHAATLALSSESEQIDPRQAWVMDSALGRNRVPSRVHVLPGSLHARGYQDTAWPASLRFLAATLTPELAPAYPRPSVQLTLDLPARTDVRVGAGVRFKGVVRPRQLGSSVSLQVRQRDGSWRTVRLVPLQRGSADTFYDLTWRPGSRGTTVWRAVWRGSGAVAATSPRTVVVR